MGDEPKQPAELLRALLSAILSDASTCHLDGSYVQSCGHTVDAYDTVAKSAEDLVQEAFRPERRQLLDFGCGAAHHRNFLEGIGYEWQGIDRLDTVSEQVSSQIRAVPSRLALYDGSKMPFLTDSFDVVYSMLVFHHLPDIGLAFSEIARVLRPGGLLIGQVSCLEQVQDFGTFNFTPYGMSIACSNVGLTLKRIYPKHDAFSFLLRRLMITLGSTDETELNEFMNPSGFFHTEVISTGQRLGLNVREINLLRIMFCTQFVFEVQA